VFGELVETCQQPKKATKGPKGQKYSYSFADVGRDTLSNLAIPVYV